MLGHDRLVPPGKLREYTPFLSARLARFSKSDFQVWRGVIVFNYPFSLILNVGATIKVKPIPPENPIRTALSPKN